MTETKKAVIIRTANVFFSFSSSGPHSYRLKHGKDPLTWSSMQVTQLTINRRNEFLLYLVLKLVVLGRL